MYKYYFTGKIHPERVDFTIGSEIPFQISHQDFNIDGNTSIIIDHSAIIVTLESNTAYGNNEGGKLETLKNFIEENVRMVVDAYCYVRSYCYEIEITNIKCAALNLDYTFGIRGEWNINKEDKLAHEEFFGLLKFFDRPERMFMRDVFSDFKRSIKYPAMTASFCYRAIETIRKSVFEDAAILNIDKRREEGWKQLNEKLHLTQSDFSEIAQFAIANRHGEYPKITYEQREKFMNFTRKIIDKLINFLNTNAA